MIDLKALFKNHLGNKNISDAGLKKFSEDHLARITANNPGGILTPIIAPTEAAHTAYFGAVSGEDVAFSVQQSHSMRVRNALRAFKKAVQQKEGLVRSHFDKDSAQYQEFFPLGLSEYTNAILANAEQLMDRLLAAATAHAPTLGSALATSLSTLRDDFVTARTAQLGRKGTTATLREASDDSREVLERRLMTNLHFIGYVFENDTEQCAAYFDQSFIRRAARRQKAEG